MEMLKFVAGYLVGNQGQGLADKLHKASLVKMALSLKLLCHLFHIQFITKSY